ncbi:MAG: DUF4830 domain-containing protein [Oscillospiraceae bacterium]|nr:DUF4830 domain-containing protein [Oscillospiraceae bacterium]
MNGKNSSKGIKILFFAILAALALAALFFFGKAKEEVEQEQALAMSSNAERVKFLNEQGFIVNPDPILKEDVVIPSQINDTYAEYVRLLTEQGFNIKPYMGRTVLRLSYEILNYPDFPEGVTANMLIADDRLIGGDISMSGESGFIRPLISNGTQNELRTQNSCGNEDCIECSPDCTVCGDGCQCGL